LCISANWTVDARFGSLADVAARSRHVRFAPKSGLKSHMRRCPLSAKSGHSNQPFQMYTLVVLVNCVEGDLDDPLKKAKAKAAATYDAAADHFDDEPLSFWEHIGKRTVTNLKLPSGAKVLDVGCGTGASALPAAQVVGQSGFVVGVDLSSRLLDRARAKATTAGLANMEFRLADMTALEYPDGNFNAVVSVFSIFFVPDMEGLVSELWRMVRSGGKLALTTWGPRIFEPAYSRWLVAVGRECPDLVTAFNPATARSPSWQACVARIERRTGNVCRF